MGGGLDNCFDGSNYAQIECRDRLSNCCVESILPNSGASGRLGNFAVKVILSKSGHGDNIGGRLGNFCNRSTFTKIGHRL